jgi:hypothetical protein
LGRVCLKFTETKISRLLPNLKEWGESIALPCGSLLGCFWNFAERGRSLPVLLYAAEKKISKHPEKFHGMICVAGPSGQ